VNSVPASFPTKKPRLDVLRFEWLPPQRIVDQVDLSDGKVVGRPPVTVDETEL
jgi:hypothetical protein